MEDHTLYSETEIARLCSPESDLSADARDVLRGMHSSGAIGLANAIGQDRLSRLSGVHSRLIQECNLEILKNGIAVCSSCSSPAGQFLAETTAEARAYKDQLHSRAMNLMMHEKLLDEACRRSIDRVAAERNGEGTLFGAQSAGPSKRRMDPG